MKILLLTLAIILTSCASYKDTIYTMEDNSKPSWVRLDKPTWEENGKIFVVSVAEVPHDSNYSSAKRISDNAARSELTKLVKNTISNDQTTTEDLKEKIYQLQSSEQMSVVTKKMTVEKNWFEIVEVNNLDETKRKELHVYSLVSIKKEDLKELIKENPTDATAKK
jgi:hypothetical protein